MTSQDYKWNTINGNENVDKMPKNSTNIILRDIVIIAGG